MVNGIRSEKWGVWMKKKLMIIGIIVLIALGIFFVSQSKSAVPSQEVPRTGDAQKVTLSMKDLNYYPQTITVKAGTPVELTLDKSVTGCLRAFTIPDLGITKYAKSPNDVIRFMPTTPGTYRFACTMGMGYGTLIVEG